ILSHPNIINICDIILKDKIAEIIMPYYDMNLKYWIVKSTNFARKIGAKTILPQILQDVSYLHSSGFIHQDLKPDNILVTDSQTLNIKLIDFNSSYFVGILPAVLDHGQEIQTLWYRAPELLLAKKYYDYAIDIWSIGCIFAEILYGDPVFPGKCEKHQIYLYGQIWHFLIDENVITKTDIHKKLLEIIPDITPEERELIVKMLDIDPFKRITATEALNSQYFSGNSLTELNQIEKETY